jgi:hypothetical protein
MMRRGIRAITPLYLGQDSRPARDDSRLVNDFFREIRAPTR